MKYLLLLCSLLCGLSAFAQINPNSKQELKSYYERNIGNLDPLEGIYDVEWTTKSRNAYIQFPEDVQSREWCIYKDKTGKFKIYGLNELTIEKIGSSSIYTFKEYFANSNTSTSSRFTLNNQSYFEVSL